MCVFRSDLNSNTSDIVFQHLNQSDNSIPSIQVRITEKYTTRLTILIFQYLSVNKKGVHVLKSTIDKCDIIWLHRHNWWYRYVILSFYSSVNVMTIFNFKLRRRSRHNHRHSTSLTGFPHAHFFRHLCCQNNIYFATWLFYSPSIRTILFVWNVPSFEKIN